MPMKYKTQCYCQIDPEEHKERFLKREFMGHIWYSQCTNCNGTGECEYNLSLDKYDGEFENITEWSENEDDELDVTDGDYDINIYFICSCGGEIHLHDLEDSEVCECGRVYRFSGNIEKNDAHKNDMEYWDKVKQSKYERFKK